MSNEDAESHNVVPPKGVYTYRVVCSFTLQYSFPHSELEQDPDGAEGKDFNPKDEALKALAIRLKETLAENFLVDEVEASAESNELIGGMRQ